MIDSVFNEYYEKFIKPSNEDLALYQKKLRKINKKIKLRTILTVCLLIFIFVVFGHDISESIKQAFETSAKNTNYPTFDKLLGITIITLFSLFAIFLLTLFIFAPKGKYELELQNDLLSKLIKFFGKDLIFSKTATDENLTKTLVDNFGLKEQDKFDSIFYGEKDWNIYEDYSIKSRFDNSKINIIRVQLSKGSGKRRKEVFKGLLLFNENSKINSQNKIIININKISYSIDQQNLKNLFTITCQDEIDKNLVSESFLKYLVTLSNQFKSLIECRIYKDKMLILIEGSDHFYFSAYTINDQPPFYKSTKEKAQKIEMLLLAFSF